MLLSDTQNIAFRAALADPTGLSIWGKNLSAFRRDLGILLYLQVLTCIRSIYFEGGTLSQL